MKILHLVFHPNLENSRVNKTWKQQLEASVKVNVSRDMYQEYPDFKIDVAKEQKLLLEHDRIILQFPLYWFSCTPLVRQWMDEVLTYGFAFGEGGNKLKAKDLQLLVSVGGQEKLYSGFDFFATIHELLRGFQMSCEYIQMNYMLPLWMYEADSATQECIEEYGKKWVEVIDAPERANGKRYILTKLLQEANQELESNEKLKQSLS